MEAWKKGRCSMEPCEWCEEEIVTMSEKTTVIGKELALCDECHSYYVNGGIKQLNRRKNWDK
jgi:ribosome-binding protein aMBF1 (putative translation factor)